jgi:hypothetical protein
MTTEPTTPTTEELVNAALKDLDVLCKQIAADIGAITDLLAAAFADKEA